MPLIFFCEIPLFSQRATAQSVQVDDLLDAFGELCDQLPLAAVIHETCGFAAARRLVEDAWRCPLIKELRG